LHCDRRRQLDRTPRTFYWPSSHQFTSQLWSLGSGAGPHITVCDNKTTSVSRQSEPSPYPTAGAATWRI